MVNAGGRFEKSPTAEKILEAAPSAVSAGGGSGEVPTGQYNIYQPPASLRGWPEDHDTEAALRHLGLLDFARLQLPDGIPRHDLVSDLVASYHRENCRGHAYLWGVRVSVDRKSFLSAAALQATADHKVLPPRRRTRSARSSSAVTCAALRFMEMWILPQFQGRDMLPSNVSAAMREVKAESAHNVDWGELIWDLVQNEILELPKRDDKNSYFGLHLLRLIWVKHPEVFGLKDRMERLARVHLDRILPQVVGNVTERIRLEFTRPKKITRFFRVQQPQVVNNLSKRVESGDEAAAVVQVQQQSMVRDEAAAVVQVQHQSMVGDEAAAVVQVQQQSMVGDEAAAVVQVQHQSMVGDEAAAVDQVQHKSMVGDEAAAVDQVQHQSMVVQSSPLAIGLNNDASVGKRDSLEAALAEPGHADAHKHGVKHVKHPEVFGLKDRMERLARVHLDKILPQVVGNVTERIRSEFTRPKKLTRFFRVQQPQVVNNLSELVESRDEAATVVQVQQQSMVEDEAAAVVQVQQQSMVGDEAAAVVQVQQQSMVGDEAAAVVQVQHQSMVVQGSPLAIVLNNGASVGKRDSLVHKDGVKHVKQQFQQGNQQKQTRNTNKCSVPSGSIVLNDDASVGKRDSMEAGLVEPGQADAHKHGVKHVKQQFQQGNRQKWTRMRSKRRVPSGSTISSTNISRDIIGIKSEVKRARLENQPTKELLEAEMFIQAITVLNETLSVDAIVHSRTLRRLAPR